MAGMWYGLTGHSIWVFVCPNLLLEKLLCRLSDWKGSSLFLEHVHYVSGILLGTRDIALSKSRHGLHPYGVHNSVEEISTKKLHHECTITNQNECSEGGKLSFSRA